MALMEMDGDLWRRPNIQLKVREKCTCSFSEKSQLTPNDQVHVEGCLYDPVDSIRSRAHHRCILQHLVNPEGDCPWCVGKWLEQMQRQTVDAGIRIGLL